MTKISKWNDAANYSSRDFDFGFQPGHIPDDPVYAAHENEQVFTTVLPYNGTPISEIEKILDPVDMAMIEEIGRSKYSTSLIIYQFVRLRGLSVKRTGLRKRLNKMKKLRLIREYEIKAPDAVRGLLVYDLDYKGFQLACRRGVPFHKGNCYISNTQKQKQGLYDTAEDIKRVLVGNMIVLANLMNGAKMERFGIMETMRPSLELPITDGSIIRTAANVKLDEESLLLYEAVRSTPHSMRRLADKVERYYKLIHDQRYHENNYYGYAAVPQLVICGESYEHCVKIDQYLRSRDLIREMDSLLYTEDLFYVGRTLQTLYELDGEGNRTWYSLPAKQTAADRKKSA